MAKRDTLGFRAPIATSSVGSALLNGGELREEIIRDLAPKTAYEALIATNIVELELAYLASRARVEGILQAACRDIVWQTLIQLQRDVPAEEAEAIARDTALAFVRRDAISEETLAQYGVTRADIEAQAYRENWVLLREIDQMQSRLEARRTDLRRDYREVQALRIGRGGSASIEDAEAV